MPGNKIWTRQGRVLLVLELNGVYFPFLWLICFMWLEEGSVLRASPQVLSMWLETIKFIAKKWKCAGLAQEINLSAPNSCSLLAVAGKRRNSCAPPKKSVINWTWLRLSISDWLIIMIGRDGLLSAVPTYMQLQLQFYWWGCPKKNQPKLRHLILLSRVTDWAPVEMLLVPFSSWCLIGLFTCLDFGPCPLFLFLSLSWVPSFYKVWQGFIKYESLQTQNSL